MSRTVTIELSDEVFAALQKQAEEAGVTPSDRLRTDAEHLYRPGADSANGADPKPAGGLRAIIEKHFPGTLGPPDMRSESEKAAAREWCLRLIGASRSGRPSGAHSELIAAHLALE